ncbi:restriction endonuclease [Streptosporangium sp. NPDC000239]|uniref:restriction endonuclease n=1 Tax=Streptosporangium sp. NPDC000239 TaxID=3154248 RepID=UPI003326586B
MIRGVQLAADLILGRWYIGIPVGAGALVAITMWARWGVAALRRRSDRLHGVRLALPTLDMMSPTAFEWAVRDLMARDGIAARHVGQRGDKVADVIGRDRGGYVIVAQCKHTTTAAKVGARVIYEVNGTAHPVHGADVAVVVTNGSFTRGARRTADDFRIHLIGREELRRWASGAVSLQGLLGLTTPLRRWQRLRRTPSLLIRHTSTPKRAQR